MTYDELMIMIDCEKECLIGYCNSNRVIDYEVAFYTIPRWNFFITYEIVDLGVVKTANNVASKILGQSNVQVVTNIG